MTIHPAKIQSDRTTKVVVIGGGYAGALAANRLRQNRDVDITVVNPRPTFVERVRLHQLVAGSGNATVELATMLSDGARLVIDSALHIDATNQTVQLASGDRLSYDFLIYAVGSTGAVPDGVPGVREFAYPIAELEQAEQLRVALQQTAPNAPICIVGGGLTGIEAASELAERRPDARVTLLCGGILGPSLAERARSSARRQLSRLGVAVLDDAVVSELGANHVRLTDGQILESAVTVWTAGFGVPDLARLSGLSTDKLGRLLTDETLTSIDDVRIVAAGDAAAPSGEPLRMSCQAAMPLGAQSADTVLARIAGTHPTAINQAFVVQNISIGRRRATIQFTNRDDTPRRMYVAGRLGAVIKEFVCKSTIKSIVRESRQPGSFRWPRAGRASKRTYAMSGG